MVGRDQVLDGLDAQVSDGLDVLYEKSLRNLRFFFKIDFGPYSALSNFKLFSPEDNLS